MANPQVVNLQKVIMDQSIISFQTKEKCIKFTIRNNNISIGNGEYILGNETRWLTVNSTNSKKKGENFTLNLIDCMRLKIRCSLSDNSSQQLRESNNSTKKPIQSKPDSSLINAQISKKHTSISCHTKSAKATKKSSSHFNSSSKQENPKKLNSNLKHNKSYEDGFESNNLLLTELSPKKPNDSYNQPRNINNYKGLGSSKHGKGINPKLFGNKRNKSYENVSQHHRSYIDNQSMPKKIKEGLKALDSIDKNYETNVKRDELSTGVNDYKKGIFRITLERGYNKSEDNVSMTERRDREQKKEDSFVLSTNQFEDETDNSNFSQLKDDFEILYTPDYIQTIPKEMIRVELHLLIENICELQDAYHKELKIELNNYSKYRELFTHYSEKYLLINKEHLKLKDEQERAHVMNIFHTFINNHKLKHTKELLSINRNEIDLWKKIPQGKSNETLQGKDLNILQSIAKGILMRSRHLLSDNQKLQYDKIFNKNPSPIKPVSESAPNKPLPYFHKGGTFSKSTQASNTLAERNAKKPSTLGNH